MNLFRYILTGVAILMINGIAAGQNTAADIRQLVARTNERIAGAEKNFAESDIFLTELVVNSGGTMYPAVGNFKETVKFYYGYGNREVSPYPNRLLKVTAVVERSSTREAREFYFNSLGVLVCVLVNDGGSAQEYYFVRGRLIRWQKGEIDARSGTPEAVSATRALKAESDRVVRIFRASVE